MPDKRFGESTVVVQVGTHSFPWTPALTTLFKITIGTDSHFSFPGHLSLIYLLFFICHPHQNVISLHKGRFLCFDVSQVPRMEPAHSRHSVNVPESQASRTGEVRDYHPSAPPFNKHLSSILSMPSIISGPGDAERRNFLPPPGAGNPDRGQGPPAERNRVSRGPRGTATGPFQEKA